MILISPFTPAVQCHPPFPSEVRHRPLTSDTSLIAFLLCNNYPRVTFVFDVQDPSEVHH